MSKKKVALVDLGGVVFQSTGISNPIIDWKTITDLNYKYGHRLNIGEDLFPTFLKEYNQLTQQNLAGREFLKSIFDTLQINQELIDLVRSEYVIYIVSDNYRENIEYISQRYHFSDWSEKQFYSFDYKLEKANPKFFDMLLSQIDEKAEELLFIDDSPKKIESAQKLGIHGILFRDNEALKKALALLPN